MMREQKKWGSPNICLYTTQIKRVCTGEHTQGILRGTFTQQQIMCFVALPPSASRKKHSRKLWPHQVMHRK